MVISYATMYFTWNDCKGIRKELVAANIAVVASETKEHAVLFFNNSMVKLERKFRLMVDTPQDDNMAEVRFADTSLANLATT